MKHLPYTEDKHKLKKLQTMSDKQALEDAGETGENDKHDDIEDRVFCVMFHSKITRYLKYMYQDIHVNISKDRKQHQAYLVYETQCINLI